MEKQIVIPTIISSIRIAVLPLFVYFFYLGNINSCFIILAFSAATDFLDGYFARKLEANSKFGSYYDATTDFIFIIGIFTIFYLIGYYPIWLLFLITASFIQFVITSLYSKKLYDPVGKYLGSALYIGIVLTLIYPTQATFDFVDYAFLIFFIISITSRVVSLSRKRV